MASQRIRLYCPQFDVGDAALAGEEVHHARNVRRVSVGDEVELFDGKGKWGRARIAEIGKDHLAVTVGAVHRDPPPPFRIVLACAIPKLSSQTCLVFHATEVGVDDFWPVIYERNSVRKISRQRWVRWGIESCKQCGRNDLPEIAEPVTLEAVLGRSGEFDAKLVGCVESGTTASSAIPGRWRRLILFIGPEGGFTDRERAMFEAHGVIPVRVGQHVMRIETAGAALAAALIFARQ